MKTSRVFSALCFVLAAVATLPAQNVAQPPPSSASAPLRTAQEIEQLVAPIALYPDALIALILPASTAPADIVLAARQLRDFPTDRSQIEHRAWDESVKSLTHYAEVVKWMDENLQWTKQLGEAFAEQPADVMQAVQRLRAKARAAGTLVDTPQQQVIAEPRVIRIVPAQPDVIYVPHYEPEIVFVDRPVYYSRPYVTFGLGVAVGSWLAFDCDWHRHTVWAGNRHRHWQGHDWRRPVVPIAPVAHGHFHSPETRQWRPVAHPPRSSVSVSWHSRPTVARPTPFGSSTARYSGPRSPTSDGRRDARDHRDAQTPPTVPLSRTYTPSAREREDLPGPRAISATPAMAPTQPLARTRNSAPTALNSAPAQTPAPGTRSYGNSGGNRGERGDRADRDPRSRPSQSELVGVAHAPSAPPARSLPMANVDRSAHVTGPIAAPAPRSFSQSRPQPGPEAAPPARAYPQARSHSASASAPSLPMVSIPRSHSVVGPVAPASAPAAVPAAAAPAAAPARAEPNEDRRGRRNGQTHEP